MSLKFNCSNCSQKIVVKYLKVGETAKCRQCQSDILVPTDALTTNEEQTIEQHGITVDVLRSDNSTKPQRCGWATLSLLLGIVGLLLCSSVILAIFSILAVIFGIIALRKIDASKGVLAGKGVAIAGVVLGAFWLNIILFSVIVFPRCLIRGNEMSAVASLRLMTSVEAAWLQQDTDNNGVNDYWTYDISCFYRALRADSETKVAFVSLYVARADAKPARADVFENDHFQIINLPGANPIPYKGYYFQMMESDQDGKLYNQEKVNGVPAANKNRFAIVAYPAIYGTNGVYTIIVNQEGTRYATDCGSDAKKIVLQWPGNNPTATIGPGGEKWGIAEYIYYR